MWRSLIAICLIVSLSGCGSIGAMASKTQTFMVNETVSFSRTPTNYLDTSAEIGKTLGYSVSGLDRSKNMIAFSKDAGMFIGVLVGKMEHADVTLTFKDEGRVVDISVSVLGNFGTGGQDAGSTILAEFKSKLTERLG